MPPPCELPLPLLLLEPDPLEPLLVPEPDPEPLFEESTLVTLSSRLEPEPGPDPDPEPDPPPGPFLASAASAAMTRVSATRPAVETFHNVDAMPSTPIRGANRWNFQLPARLMGQTSAPLSGYRQNAYSIETRFARQPPAVSASG